MKRLTIVLAAVLALMLSGCDGGTQDFQDAQYACGQADNDDEMPLFRDYSEPQHFFAECSDGTWVLQTHDRTQVRP